MPDYNALFEASKKTTPESLQEEINRLNRLGHAATAMITATKLDQWLQMALLARFTHKPKRLVSKLFEPMKPLDSFSAKIDLSFALGLISDGTCKTLHTLRKVRNEFAHSEHVIDFSSDIMDPHFSALHNQDDTQSSYPTLAREVAFLEAAVDSINEIRERIRPLVLARALKDGSSQDKSP